MQSKQYEPPDFVYTAFEQMDSIADITVSEHPITDDDEAVIVW